LTAGGGASPLKTATAADACGWESPLERAKIVGAIQVDAEETIILLRYRELTGS
jgi:hypothetical protein